MGEYRLKDTPVGQKTLVYIDSREIKLHSAYDPIREAIRSTASFKKGRANFIIVCGLGLGYHINILKENCPECMILVIERDKEVIEITRETYPENLKDISIVNSTSDLPSIFEDIDISTIMGLSTFYHRPSYMLYSDFYDAILRDIREYISSKVSDLLTRFEFEESWLVNILSNIHRIFSYASVDSIFGKFRKYPGIIVSAGPSLRRNVKLLEVLRDKALIVCVDTALKVLERNNVRPHLVMTLDSQNYSLKHFVGLEDYSSILIADIVSSPKVIRSYRGKKLISTTSKYYIDKNCNLKRETTPLVDWIEQYTGSLGDIQSGGSVATSIFDLLLNLGCSPIILIGQDLAYTGREIHCSGTYHNDEWLPMASRFSNLETYNQNIIRKRKIKYVKAYKGDGVTLSDFVFDLYRCWFEDSAAKIKIPVINATEGGARIANTEECSLEELIDKIQVPERSPDEILRDFIPENHSRDPERLYMGLRSAIDTISNIRDLSEERLGGRNLYADKIFQLVSEDNVSKIITPFLRKTFIYLTRHPEIDQEKSTDLLATEIATVSKRLLKLLELSKTNIEKVRYNQ